MPMKEETRLRKRRNRENVGVEVFLEDIGIPFEKLCNPKIAQCVDEIRAADNPVAKAITLAKEYKAHYLEVCNDLIETRKQDQRINQIPGYWKFKDNDETRDFIH